MDNSPRVNLPSLRNILLKSTAIHFDRIFLNIDQDHGHVLKKNIRLPPHIFEDIQSKGNEIGWPIPAEFLKQCLAFRDVLNWVNVNLLLGPYDVNDILKIQNTNLPLKQLSFRIYFMTLELYSLIQKFSSDLEILHIGGYCLSTDIFNNLDVTYITLKEGLKFPNLKKLILDFKVEYLLEIFQTDLTYSKYLQSIEINHLWYFYHDKRKIIMDTFERFLESFKVLHKVRSFSCLFLTDYSYCDILEHICYLKNLRSLRIIDPSCFFYESHLESITKELPHLECLDIDTPVSLRAKIEFLKSNKLKYLGILLDNKRKFPRIDHLARTVCSSPVEIDSLLTNFEYSSFSETLPRNMIYLTDSLKVNASQMTDIQWKRLEKFILIVIQRYWAEVNAEAFLHSNLILQIGDDKHQWTTCFLGKFANFIVNFAFYQKMDPAHYVHDYRPQKKLIFYGS